MAILITDIYTLKLAPKSILAEPSNMDLEELKQELTLCTEKEQDSLAAYLLYLRLKRKPKDIQDLHNKVTDPALSSWGEELFNSQE